MQPKELNEALRNLIAKNKEFCKTGPSRMHELVKLLKTAYKLGQKNPKAQKPTSRTCNCEYCNTQNTI